MIGRGQRIRNQGLGLVSAIFFLVVISVLAMAISRSVRDASEGSVIEHLGFQAFLVAESGAQVAVAHALPDSGSAVCSALDYDFANLGHRNCRAIVSCQAFNSATETIYEIESRGRCALPSGEIAERVIEVSVQR